MNQHRTIDLAKSYRANDIAAADAQRRRTPPTIDTPRAGIDADAGVVGQPARVGLTVRRFILRSA